LKQRRREVNATVGTPFRNIHAIMHPSVSGGTVVQLPPKAPDKVTMDRGGGSVAQPPKKAPVNDLLDGGSYTVQNEPTAQLTDFFDSVTISSPPSSVGDSNPFNTFAQVPVPQSMNVTPTIAQLPVKPPAPTQQHAPVTPFGSPPGTSFPYQQGYVPQMVNQNNIGHPSHVPQGVYATPPQYQPSSGYQVSPPTQQNMAFHPPPMNQSPTLTGPPHTATTVSPQSQQQQRPTSNTISQFDPFAKR
jgi:hypothetical protein